MKHSLYTVEGKDEFVVTPAADHYIVALRLTEDEAAVVGHERIAIHIQVLEGGVGAGIYKVSAIGANNEPGDEIEPACQENGTYSPYLQALLAQESIADRLAGKVKEFLDDVGGFDAANEYYDMLGALHAMGHLNG